MPHDQSIFNPVEEVLWKTSQKIASYKSFYPSDASCIVKGRVVGRCLRYQFWRWKGLLPPERPTWRLALSAKLGDGCEQFFLDLYKRSGLLKGSQVGFFLQVMGLNISGRVDGLTKKGELIECKSAYGTAFFNQVNKAPKEEHLIQILVYLACLGLHVCILPYICRDNAAKRQGYRMSKKEIEAKGITFIGILSRWKRLKEYIDKDELPPCDYEPKSWNCGYCIYKVKCEEENRKNPTPEKKQTVESGSLL